MSLGRVPSSEFFFHCRGSRVLGFRYSDFKRMSRGFDRVQIFGLSKTTINDSRP